jgi:hypothetical protein
VALVEQYEKGFASFGIETDERLVDEEQVEGADESERNRRFLTKTSTESGGQIIGSVEEPESSEKVGCALFPALHTVQSGDVFEVLPDGQVVVERRCIGEKTESSASFDRIRGRAEQRDSAVIRVEKPDCDSEEGRLARSVVSDESHALSCGNGECEGVEGRSVSVVLGNVDRSQSRVIRHECPF